MLKRSALKTAKGSLTNACIIESEGKELLFSYNTLVGVATPEGRYFQRDGLARSRTTAKHIKLWLDGRNAVQVTEGELNRIAEGE